MEEDDHVGQRPRRGVYADIDNSNNMTLCLRLVDHHRVKLATQPEDGHTYCFLVESPGPVLPVEAVEALFAIHFVMSFAPSSKRVLQTATLVPEFDDTKEKNFKGLILRRQVEPGQLFNLEGSREKLDGYGGLADIPADEHCRILPENAGDYYVEESRVPLCDVFLSPVRTRRRGVAGRASDGKVYWLIMARTRRSFDFMGHIQDIYDAHVKELSSLKQKRGLDPIGPGLDIVRRVMLLAWKMSPGARAELVGSGNSRQEPWERFNPSVLDNYSLDVATSIVEAFRGMTCPCVEEDGGECLRGCVPPRA